MLIADSLATIYAAAQAPSLSPTGRLAMYAYGTNLRRFSGYSDVAIGVSLLLGCGFRKTSTIPYLAKSLQTSSLAHLFVELDSRDLLFVARRQSRSTVAGFL